MFAYRKHEPSILTWLKGNKTHADIQYFADEQISVIARKGYKIVQKVLNEYNCMLLFGNEKVVQNTTEIKH